MKIKATLIGLFATISTVAYSQAYYMHEAAEDAGYRPHDSPLFGILTIISLVMMLLGVLCI